MLTVYRKFHSNIRTFRAHQIFWTALETPLLPSRDFPNNVVFTFNQNVTFLKCYNSTVEGFPGTPQVWSVYRFSTFWTASLLTILLQALRHVGHVQTRVLDFGNHFPFQLSNFSNPTISRKNHSLFIMPTAFGKSLSNFRVCWTFQNFWQS